MFDPLDRLPFSQTEVLTMDFPDVVTHSLTEDEREICANYRMPMMVLRIEAMAEAPEDEQETMLIDMVGDMLSQKRRDKLKWACAGKSEKQKRRLHLNAAQVVGKATTKVIERQKYWLNLNNIIGEEEPGEID